MLQVYLGILSFSPTTQSLSGHMVPTLAGTIHLLAFLFYFRQSLRLHPSGLSPCVTSLREGSADHLMPGGEVFPPAQLEKLYYIFSFIVL